MKDLTAFFGIRPKRSASVNAGSGKKPMFPPSTLLNFATISKQQQQFPPLSLLNQSNFFIICTEEDICNSSSHDQGGIAAEQSTTSELPLVSPTNLQTRTANMCKTRVVEISVNGERVSSMSLECLMCGFSRIRSGGMSRKSSGLRQLHIGDDNDPHVDDEASVGIVQDSLGLTLLTLFSSDECILMGKT